MEMSQLLLCEGNISFVFKTHPATEVVIIADTEDTGVQLPSAWETQLV